MKIKATPMTAPVVREMTLADCHRVSEIHVRGWQRAYRGLMPQSHLDGMSVEEDAERRRGWFTAGGSTVNLVAEQDGRVVGWAAHGPFRDDYDWRPGDAELYDLYVDHDLLGRGFGRALLAESVRRSVARGDRRMYLWVVEAHIQARRFYERAGFRSDGTVELWETDGVPVPEVRYVSDLVQPPEPAHR